MKQRITGFDLARALAIFGMVIVNFKIAMQAESGSKFLLWSTALLEGRASALFVMLAGIGVSLLLRRGMSGRRSELLACRRSLVKRGLVLIALGLLFIPIWPADILHFMASIFCLQQLYLI
ncbi:heparan-alpha-glucosaminide N-acetyltransferase domain-containing protein [Alginatibacterium sediminis]|uniref:heparan-alpha-glucosaminide N-acetyltransferase domain-containing protein n=1 Tax=Alginatibacterium sediminis TaxID=2164068 RepID=UPI001F1774C2|nr:heparan-alpha-glucosaminide N-acetyltransferase domain-containing protein [Alginatibacterium sediminis]